MAYFVYILLCKNGSYYTGITNNLDKRLRAHQSGKGAKYTRMHPAIKVVYQKECKDKSTALMQELAIKKLTHTEKQKLFTV